MTGTVEAETTFELKRTGASVVADIRVSDDLRVIGKYTCYETEIVGVDEATRRYTPEISGGRIEAKTRSGFRAEISFTIGVVDQIYSGSQRIAANEGGIGDIHLVSESEDENLMMQGLRSEFLLLTRGLSSCDLLISTR